MFTAFEALQRATAGEDRPLHAQIRVYVLGLIESGEYQPGQKLPTEVELTAKFGVSRVTVQRALNDLARAGVVERHRGRGTFISEKSLDQPLVRLTGFVEDMDSLGLSASARVVLIEEIELAPDSAIGLGAMEPGRAVHIQRVRLGNERPVSFDDSYIPIELGRQLAQEDLSAHPLFALMEEKFDIQLGHAEYALQASTAPPGVEKELGLVRMAPAMVVDRETYDNKGNLVLDERIYYRGDLMKFRLKLER